MGCMHSLHCYVVRLQARPERQHGYTRLLTLLTWFEWWRKVEYKCTTAAGVDRNASQPLPEQHVWPALHNLHFCTNSAHPPSPAKLGKTPTRPGTLTSKPLTSVGKTKGFSLTPNVKKNLCTQQICRNEPPNSIPCRTVTVSSANKSISFAGRMKILFLQKQDNPACILTTSAWQW